MYWILGKFIATILVILFLVSPFIKPLRRKWLSYEWFRYSWFGEVYEAIEDREIDSGEEAFGVILMMLASLVLGIVGWFLVLLLYPLIILILVVMWALKTLYSNKNKV